MLTGIIEEPLRSVIVQAGAEALAALLLPMVVLLVVGGVVALLTAFAARRKSATPITRITTRTPTLRPAA